ncbi:carbohydrate-binding protein [Dysgonomonas sp. 521]|uniref:glycoside hydrolase family 43 protein n=1 Tax=Dysgonomonas sp. 521 TaxID=2302932 RepID=UPI0013D5E926|nr:glycoside hydrolase family 43 protein [Dysgonomonas sp. 521]NDV95139.1 carbohydrate-binding protein [Dysgonomonas sp. 521]
MKYNNILSLLILGIAATFIAKAQNPIIQTAYTADPAPMVYNDKLYLYTSHDEANSTWFTMNDWKLYTTSDMVNWTDHGVVLKYTDFEWAKSDAWAAQCIERDGKFYMYVPVISRENNRGAVGVAVADSPYGPFYDPLGKPLVQTEWGDIDPTVFVDDDGQAYLYWGNPNCYYVKLNEDMISFEGEVVKVPMTEETFGKREGDAQRATLYEEAPWLYKRNELYYLFWAGGPIPEHLGYSTSTNPTGSWKYSGTLMPTEGGSFTNHPGVIDFRGKTYLFYHNAGLPGGSGFTRSVCVQEMKFNTDGTIPQVNMTKGITQPLSNINPYVKTEAETIAWSEGVNSYQNNQVGVFIEAKKNGAYTMVRSVDFRESGATRFIARIGTTHNSDVTLDVRLDGTDGKTIATINVPRTGGNDRWALVTTEIEKVTGIHDLYFVFQGKAQTDILFFDYWRFAK